MSKGLVVRPLLASAHDLARLLGTRRATPHALIKLVSSLRSGQRVVQPSLPSERASRFGVGRLKSSKPREYVAILADKSVNLGSMIEDLRVHVVLRVQL